MGQGFELFALYRWLLCIVCTVYAVLQIARTTWSWIEFLWEPEYGRRTLRHYVVLQLVRIRFRRFVLSLAEIGVLSAALLYLMWLHQHWGYVG